MYNVARAKWDKQKHKRKRNRKPSTGSGTHVCVVMHDGSVVVGQHVVRVANDDERGVTGERRDEVLLMDGHVTVAIRPLVFVPQAERVTDLVHRHADLYKPGTGNRQSGRALFVRNLISANKIRKVIRSVPWARFTNAVRTIFR